MQPEEHTPHLQEDPDIQFDMHEVDSPVARPDGENADLRLEKEEQQGRNEFRPLSDNEKRPKLQDEERIREMNRRTAIDD